MRTSTAKQCASEMREMTYMCFVDALNGLKNATRLIDERVQREGSSANYSANSDLLEWAQVIWKHSNALYALDQIIESLSRDEILNQEVGSNDLVTAHDDSSCG